jgi:hypothetical protein
LRKPYVSPFHNQGAKAVQEQMRSVLPHLRALPVALWPLARLVILLVGLLSAIGSELWR